MAEATIESIAFSITSRDALSNILEQGARQLLAHAIEAEFVAGRAAITYFTTECALTNKRVIAKSGFINRKTIELLLSKVEGIHVNQGLIGRLFDLGSVRITGTGGTSSGFPGIAQPLEFRKRVQQRISEMDVG